MAASSGSKPGAGREASTAGSSEGVTRKLSRINLNSPFVVTVIGGILAGLLTTWLQYRIAESQKAEAIRTEKAERKVKLAYEFANEFPTSLNLAVRFKTRELWLKTNRFDTVQRFRDGRNYVETRTFYEELLDRYLKQQPSASFCNQVIGSFHSPTIPPLAQALSDDVDTVIGAVNDAQIDAAFDQANNHYRDLTKDIFTELNRPNEK